MQIIRYYWQIQKEKLRALLDKAVKEIEERGLTMRMECVGSLARGTDQNAKYKNFNIWEML